MWLNATFPFLPRSRVLLRGLTIANGNGVTGPNSGMPGGAGIWNQADLTIEDCVVRNHNGHLGAAIVNEETSDPTRRPKLTMRNTEVRDNTTQTNGAGMTVGPRVKVVVEGCLFSNNHADAPGGSGGAIAAGTKSKLFVTNSEFSGNSSGGGGGGALTVTGSAKIFDSVISGNTTAGSGGGIFRSSSPDGGGGYYAPGPLILVVDSTITGNRADSDDSGLQFGGGVMSSSLRLRRVDTAIVGNFGTGGAPDDCACWR